MAGPGSFANRSSHCQDLGSYLNIELVGMSFLPNQQEGLVVPLMDARRNNVYAGFMVSTCLSEAHLSFAEVLES